MNELNPRGRQVNTWKLKVSKSAAQYDNITVL